MDVYNSDEEDSEPIIKLKDGVNLKELIAGAEFEVDLSDLKKNEEVKQYKSSGVYKFYKEDVLDQDEENDNENESLFERLSAKMENLTPDGGVKKQMLQHGVGDVVPAGAHVTVHYNGYLEHADEPFDSSRLRQTPLSFDLGSDQVLLGFELAVASMRMKEQARFLIQPEYALGEIGCPPRIPGNSQCLYVIELLNFIDLKGVGEYFMLPMSERNDAPFELVMKAVKKTKQDAKSCFESKKFTGAINAYRKAINILEKYHLKNDEEEAKQKQILLQLYQNVALCNLKVGRCGKVIHYSNEALSIEPNSHKALYLKGKALRQLSDFDRAKVELLKAYKLCPKSKEIAEELQKLERSSQLFCLDEKKLYQRMFGQADKNDEKASEADDRKTSTTSGDLPMDEISQMFAEKLKMFVDDPELVNIPYSTASNTAEELDCLEAIAKKMGLLVLRKQQGNNIHIRICKHNEAS